MKDIKIIFLIIIFNYIFNCFFVSSIQAKKDKIPDWVRTGKSMKYPTELFIIGIGRAYKSRDELKAIKIAENEARADLISKIKIKVQANLQTFIKEEQIYRQSGKEIISKTSGKQNIISEITAKTEIELENIEIVEHYYDKKKKIYYALAVLNRDLTASKFQNYIYEKRQTAELYFNNGLKAMENQEYFSAIANFKKARHEIIDAQAKTSLLSAILAQPINPFKNGITLWQCDSAIQQALQSIRFVVKIFEDNPFTKSNLVESKIIEKLRSEGYNVIEASETLSEMNYEQLSQMSFEQLQEIIDQKGNYLIIGKVIPKESSQIMLGKTPIYFYFSSAEVKVINLKNREVIANETFDWGDKTKAGKNSKKKAVSASLSLAGEFLAKSLTQKLQEISKSPNKKEDKK